MSVVRRLHLMFTAALITAVVLAAAFVVAGEASSPEDSEADLVAIDRPYGLWTRNALEQVRKLQTEPVQFFDTGEVIALSPEALQVQARAAQFSGPEAAAKYGIPGRAIASYKLAAQRMNKARPGCDLPWTLLAGIGRVESDHGRFRGSAVTESGLVRPKIIGIPLNGAGPVAAIPDSDGGLMDGDKLWDRAVGPMQFIPTTWATSGRDGDGDGIADPHDLDDAAFAAAGYLCPESGSLSDESTMRAAIFTYNHSTSYVNLVMAYERSYRTGVFELPDPTPGPPQGLPDSPYGEPGAEGELPAEDADGEKNQGKKNGGTNAPGTPKPSESPSPTKPPKKPKPTKPTKPPKKPKPTKPPQPPAEVSFSGTLIECAESYCVSNPDLPEPLNLGTIADNAQWAELVDRRVCLRVATATGTVVAGPNPC